MPLHAAPARSAPQVLPLGTYFLLAAQQYGRRRIKPSNATLNSQPTLFDSEIT